MTVPFTLLAKVAAMDSVIVLLIFNPVHTDFHTNRQDLLNSNSGGVYFFYFQQKRKSFCVFGGPSVGEPLETRAQHDGNT